MIYEQPCVCHMSLGAGGDVGNHPQLLPVVVMLELLGLLVPQVVLHNVQEVIVVVVQILLRMRLVRDLGARSLDHGVDPDVADLVVVHALGSPGVDDWLMTQHWLSVNSGHSVNVDLVGQISDGPVLVTSITDAGSGGHWGLGTAIVIQGRGGWSYVTLVVTGDQLSCGGAVTLQVISDQPSEARRQVRALVIRPELGWGDRA